MAEVTVPEGLDTKTLEHKGKKYIFREITVDENDEALEAAKNPDGNTINTRVMNRMIITASAVDPQIALDDIAKMPHRLYQKIVDLVNELNDPDRVEEDPNVLARIGRSGQKQRASSTPIPSACDGTRLLRNGG